MYNEKHMDALFSWFTGNYNKKKAHVIHTQKAHTISLHFQKRAFVSPRKIYGSRKRTQKNTETHTHMHTHMHEYEEMRTYVLPWWKQTVCVLHIIAIAFKRIGMCRSFFLCYTYVCVHFSLLQVCILIDTHHVCPFCSNKKSKVDENMSCFLFFSHFKKRRR